MVRSLYVGVSVLLVACAAANCADGRDTRHTARLENRPPLGAIEEPREGTTVPRLFKVRGWAADDRGIRMVRVFLDGELISLGEFAWDRPDVSSAHPDFRHGTDRHGWEAMVETVPGSHTVRAEAVDIDYVTSDLGSRNFIVFHSDLQ